MFWFYVCIYNMLVFSLGNDKGVVKKKDILCKEICKVMFELWNRDFKI